jgi:hypothetical protein
MVRYSFLCGSFIPDYTPVYPDDGTPWRSWPRYEPRTQATGCEEVTELRSRAPRLMPSERARLVEFRRMGYFRLDKFL